MAIAAKLLSTSKADVQQLSLPMVVMLEVMEAMLTLSVSAIKQRRGRALVHSKCDEAGNKLHTTYNFFCMEPTCPGHVLERSAGDLGKLRGTHQCNSDTVCVTALPGDVRTMLQQGHEEVNTALPDHYGWL